MTIRVALTHRTHYQYDRAVSLGPHIVRLRPAPHCRTPILSHSLRVKPKDHFLNWQQDPQSNFLARLAFPSRTTELELLVDLVAEMTVINPFDFFLDEAAEEMPFEYDAWLGHELKPFLATGPQGPLFDKYLASYQPHGRAVDFLVELNASLQQHIEYMIRLEPGVQKPEETLQKRKGSCRDSAWLLVHLLRGMGLAARFVSGYLIQLVADVKPLDGPAGTETDFTDLHAWAEVYLPGAGWVGLDPTSGLFAAEGHIPLAATPDPFSAAPISGAVGECEVEFSFEMNVTRIHEDPRVTKPYTEEQWAEVDALGEQVDRDLIDLDVRLTMGGEPTFVSIDDMDGEQWNTGAVGEHKRELAGDLFLRMRERYAPGGLLHYGQGKWYPGESLPRWALSCFWRVDGEPLWHDDSLRARDGDGEAVNADAEAIGRAIAERLGVGSSRVIPAYEDVWYYLWREERLPDNVNPFESKLEDKEERARLARVFGRGLGEAAGFVLPLSKGVFGYGMEWVSPAWKFRGGRMCLLPGDSPVGLRLPLDALPKEDPSDEFAMEPVDPTASRPPLRSAADIRRGVGKRRAVGNRWAVGNQRAVDMRADDVRPHTVEQKLPDQPAEGETKPRKDVMRTALCVQVRDGIVHVFMPPLRRLEDYLELVTAVEDSARDVGTPVRLEGYPPPTDPRLKSFKVTPDPGVIEVNVHPSSSWRELSETTNTLFEDARQSRLGTEKFMLDGRHSGTGGGNHVVLGGATPKDSPFLRRPDLLRSLVGYWLNHPSLSYLFSGLFIGPTSQAPRVDEARPDAVYELEIAFGHVPTPGEKPIPLWVVDRIFRHLLVDATGNTHRSEFCIDKLYSPDGPTGRLGLLEFRSFEMPPHPRMSLTQGLLLRALIARFWRNPYHGRLIRWGTELHDRFLLPHYTGEDFRDVLEDLDSAGYPMRFDWFAPHFEFRFPALGRVECAGIEVELRRAIEPWNVLGEEMVASGTARFVDSSVERLQVCVRGVQDARHIVTCNGRPVPLRATGVRGEYVGAVRFRAWQPPSCLHPTIGVHSPLVFDVVDSWSNRSIGGCTYNVSHPGGRSYDTFPVNAFEAESRRTARFFAHGHTPGPMKVVGEVPNPEFPLTLDLRRPPGT